MKANSFSSTSPGGVTIFESETTAFQYAGLMESGTAHALVRGDFCSSPNGRLFQLREVFGSNEWHFVDHNSGSILMRAGLHSGMFAFSLPGDSLPDLCVHF